jgi:hypothetical protein
MAPLILGVLLGLSAIAASDTIQRTWGSVLYVYHGEKIPTLATTGSYDLTPWGAHTLGDAGSAIRDRYLHPPTNTTETYAPIYGLSTDDIDNTQLTITSTDDEFVTASALSFMAALYPPMHYLVWGQEYHLSNGTYIEYPLDGYQYPNIETVSYLDFNYIW